MLETVLELLKLYLTPKLTVFIISMLPILELRGGLIAASLLRIPWQEAVPLAILGNIIPVPFIIYFIERILNFLAQHGPIQGLAQKFIDKGRTGGEELRRKYPNSLFWGLLFFVGIPLPGTGAWTGSLVAAFLGLEPRKAFLPIGLGLILATIIMLIITYFVPNLFGF